MPPDPPLPPEKWRAQRISRLFPPAALAYSFLLKAPGHSLSVAELHRLICRFPLVADAITVHLLPRECLQFGLDGTFLDQPLEFFVDFTVDDLISVLQDSCFAVTPDGVSLASPPEIDVGRTLSFLRQISRSADDYAAAASQSFIAYFHCHRVDSRSCAEPAVDEDGACP
jgi:hypothetical protein